MLHFDLTYDNSVPMAAPSIDLHSVNPQFSLHSRKGSIDFFYSHLSYFGFYFYRALRWYFLILTLLWLQFSSDIISFQVVLGHDRKYVRARVRVSGHKVLLNFSKITLTYGYTIQKHTHTIEKIKQNTSSGWLIIGIWVLILMLV